MALKQHLLIKTTTKSTKLIIKNQRDCLNFTTKNSSNCKKIKKSISKRHHINFDDLYYYMLEVSTTKNSKALWNKHNCMAHLFKLDKYHIDEC